MNDESCYIERFIENWHPAINVFNGYQSNDIAEKQDYKLAFNSFKKAFVFLSEDNNPRHPAQLYEAIFCLFLFLYMYRFWKNKRDSVGPGYMFGFLCIVLWSERFLDEFLKENQAAFENGMSLNMGQILSIPFILIGIYMVWRSKKPSVQAGS